MNTEVDVINRLIKARRSVFTKQFVPGAKVDDTIVRQMLENATWAPNHGQQEPWRFVVFTGKGLQKLATFQSELYKEHAGAQFVEKKYLKLQSQPMEASHVIAICMKRTTAKAIHEIEDVEAVACAVQNMYLTATAYGVGCYWSTGGITYNEYAKSFFGLQEHDRLLGFFFIGQIASPSPEQSRQPIAEKMDWIDE